MEEVATKKEKRGRKDDKHQKAVKTVANVSERPIPKENEEKNKYKEEEGKRVKQSFRTTTQSRQQ